MHVLVVGHLGAIGDELSVGGPVVRKLRAFRVENALRRSAAQRLTHQAHTPIIASAKENFATVWRPDGSQFGLRSPNVGETKAGALAQQIHHPDRGQDSVRVIVSVQSYVSLVWR